MPDVLTRRIASRPVRQRALRWHAMVLVALAMSLLLAMSPVHGAALDDTASELLRHTNRLRERSGVSAVAAEPRLTAAAQRLAEFMASSDRYGHDADGQRPAQRAESEGYVDCLIAENIAFADSRGGFVAGNLATVVFNGWMTSPPHRHNMLDAEMTDVGIATAYSTRSGRHYAVQVFGRPRSLATRFELVNTTADTVTYQLAGSSHQLAPGVTRIHEQCRQASLSLRDDPQTLAIVEGARYRVEAAGSRVQLRRE